MNPCIPLPLPDDKLKEIENQARAESIHRTSELGMLVKIPFVLLPSPFPRHLFDLARDIQTYVNLIHHHAAYDDEFLTSALKSTIEVDQFTANIYKIYERTRDIKRAKEFSLGLFRSDYMVDMSQGGEVKMRQVEMNTISSAYAALAPFYGEQHRSVLSSLNHKEKLSNLPLNYSDKKMALGLVLGWKHYGKPWAAILFVVCENESNTADHQYLDYNIRRHNASIPVMHCTFKRIRETARLIDGCLIVDGQEISVVYYRTGYVPDQYGPEDWQIRMMMEESCAIKCPSARYHLVGTKKVQQELSRPGMIERYLKDPHACYLVRQTFAQLWSLDLNNEGDDAVAMAIQNPQHFVLKPQREGGGHNIYRDDIRPFLQKLGASRERQAYILMQYLQQPAAKNYPIRFDCDTELMDIVSELGIYGVVLGNKEKILENYEAGFVVRSKVSGVNEGGIAAGYGLLDSPYLI